MGVLPLGGAASLDKIRVCTEGGEGGMRGDRDVGSSRQHFLF